jgi:hypothetical protein
LAYALNTVRILTSLILVITVTTASAAADKPFVRVRWKGSELRITYHGKLMTYDYGDANDVQDLYLAEIDQIKTDYLGEKNNLVYMILDVSGPSRGAGGEGGMCGAGLEAAKILYTFDADGEAKPPVILLYESCYQNVEADTDNLREVDVGHKIAVARFDSDVHPVEGGHQFERSTFKLFDPDHPEEGFSTAEVCVDTDTSGAGPITHKQIPCPK